MPVVARKMEQMVGLLILLGAFFLVLSVSSYSPDDPAWNYYVSHGSGLVQNRGGFIGAALADWGVQAFGSTVVGLAAFGGFGAWCLLQGHLKLALALLWRGLLCFITGSGAMYLLFTSDPILGPTLIAGGIGGKWLADLLVFYVSRPGAYVVFSSVALIALCAGVRLPWLAVLWRGLVGLGRGSRAVGWHMSAGFKEVSRVVQEQGEVASRRVGRVTDWMRLDALRRPANLPEPVEESPDAPPPPRSDAVATVPVMDDTPLYEADEPPPPVHLVSVATRPPAPSASEELAEIPRSRAKMRRPALPAPTLPGPVPEQPVAVALAVPAGRQAERELPRQSPGTIPREPVSPARVEKPVVIVEARSAGPLLQNNALPSLDLLDVPPSVQRGQSPEELDAEARFLEQKLREFGVDGEVVQVLPGPVITMFEFAPAAGVKVNKIVSLQDDLALVMRALSVRVVAPIPGKAVVGIEVPHKRRETVRFRELLDSEEFRGASSKLTLALGKDILGRPVVTDLALIPHLLIAGATGSGKSVGLNSLICSLLFRATPADVKMIMIDPKMLEFSVYDGVPHLLVPVVTDPKRAAVVLRRVVEEMTRRYQLLAAQGVRSIAQYNQTIDEEERSGETTVEYGEPWDQHRLARQVEGRLPYLVVVIDELSDLMMVSAREVEDSLMRLAQMARAAGIHLIVATQRPSVDVLTGVIKANFPARLSFQVTSKVDSRTILDMNGAETLLGRGDMLFLAPGTSKPQRVHGAYVSEAEIGRLVTAWKALAEPQYDESFCTPLSQNVDVEDSEYDEKYDEAVALVTKTGQASISTLQRRLRVGYNRAARMIEMMEKEGVVGPANGIKQREVLLRNTFDDD